jgi:NAD-dependent dihydropyrimidine dehydrogenase PreA subunit
MSTQTASAVRRPGVLIHPEQCKGCRRCVRACPNSILVVSDHINSHGHLTVRVEGEECTGCGICFYTCPEPGAITVYRKDRENAA